MFWKRNRRTELSQSNRTSTVSPLSIWHMLTYGVMVLLVLASVARAQMVQTIDSEAHLASVLCRHPKDEATNELLLNSNAHLVNVTLWNALLDCASSAQRPQSPANSLEIYKIM